MGAAGVAVFSTDGGFDFSVSTGLFGVHLLIRDLGLSSRGRGRKARMGSGLRPGERARHLGASAGLLGEFPDYENVLGADDPASLTFF